MTFWFTVKRFFFPCDERDYMLFIAEMAIMILVCFFFFPFFFVFWLVLGVQCVVVA
jgi:hypothetical protein